MKKSPDSVFIFGFSALFVLQLLGIVYINLFRNAYHLGEDSAKIFTNAMEIWNQGSLLPDTVRHNFSTLSFDTVMPFAALLYGLTGNIFVSFGIVNIIFAGLLAYVFFLLLKDLTGGKNRLAILVPLCILFSPYVVYFSFNHLNPLNDFYSLLFASAAFWAFRLLTGLVCIKAFLDPRNKAVIAVSCVMVFICAVSTGLYIFVTFAAPMILFLAVRYLAGKNSTGRFALPVEFFLIALWGGLTVAGRLISYFVFSFQPNDMPSIVRIFDFVSNIQSIYLGYLSLLGTLAYFTEVPAVSHGSIMLMSNMFIAHALLVGAVIIIRGAVKKNIVLSDSALLFVAIIASNILVFALTFTRYASPFIETRYLIPVAAALIALFGVFLSAVKWTARVRKAVLGGLLVTLIISNVFSFWGYINKGIDDQHELSQMLADFDVGLVYTADAFVTENLRVLDTGRVFHAVDFSDGHFLGVRRHGYGGYTHYLMPGSFVGPTILLANNIEHEWLPEDIRYRYVFVKYTGFMGWNIYLAGGNYINQ